VPESSDSVKLLVVAALVASMDQLTKVAVVSAIGPAKPKSRLDLPGGWIALDYTENRGIAFGLLSELGPLLAVASVVVLIALLSHYMRTSAPPVCESIGLGAILGGAVGNLIDRARLGYVIDFVSIGAWPTFNVADSAITVGAVLLIWGWMYPGVPRDRTQMS
jgi:signal peptidase II